MSKIPRKNMKVFASNAGAQQLGVVGSLAAAAPTYSTDPETIQSLANYLTGWYGVVIGVNSPALQDFNSLCYLFAYQLAYLFQTGVAEWNTSTTYFIGSLVNDGLGNLFYSVTDNNVGNALTDATNWRRGGSGYRDVTTTDAGTTADAGKVLRCDVTGGSFTATLPTLASSIGMRVTYKVVGSGTNVLTLKGNGSEDIDNTNTISLNQASNDSVTVFNAKGTVWDLL